jgi:hypothetical protein
MKRYRKLAGIAGATTVVGFLCYDAYKCIKILRKPLDTAFMTKKAEFIFIPVSFETANQNKSK